MNAVLRIVGSFLALLWWLAIFAGIIGVLLAYNDGMAAAWPWLKAAVQAATPVLLVRFAVRYSRRPGNPNRKAIGAVKA